MNITYEIIGQLIQALGVFVVLGSQVLFVWRVRKKYGSLRTAFLEIQLPAKVYDEKEIKETARDKQKLKKAFEEHPHAHLLYQNFKWTVFGLIFTLAGLIVSMIEGNLII